MNKPISHEFTSFELLQFTFPSIVMMVFMSFYTIVDGLFLARFAGTDAFAAVNIAYPLIALIFSISLMLGTGGSAVVANLMGRGRKLEARQCLTFIVLTAIVVIGILALISLVFLDQVTSFLGADNTLSGYVKDYLRIILIFAIPATLQALFISFFVTASRPRLGLFYTILSGISNIILDYILIVHFDMGIEGAALATASSFCFPAIGGIVYFLKRNRSLCFARPRLRLDILKESSINGSSEMINNLSSSIITYIFNITMIKHAGAGGVAAIGIILYCQFLFTALFIGYSVGVAPVISYHYGAANKTYFRHLIRVCLAITVISSLILSIATYLSSNSIISVFSEPGTRVYDLASTGLKIFSISILFSGINIFASAMFTAISKGKTSLILSLSRSLVFILLGISVFVYYYHTNGIWMSLPFAEMMTIIISIFFIIKHKKEMSYT